MAKRPRLDRKAELEKFEHFVFEMDDVLEAFVEAMERAGFTLDYSADSLDRLEQFLLNDKSSGADKEMLMQRSARYYGETVRKVFGGRWQLEINNPQNIYYGLPVVTGHAPSTVVLCPLQMVRMFCHGQPPGYFKRVIMNHISPRQLDIKPEK